MKTGILVHGCHLGAYDWRGIAWGHPAQQQLGRIPKAVLVALQHDAECIVFGTGASEKTVTRDGVAVTCKEGEYTRDYLLAHFEDLHGFEVFRDVELGPLKRRIAAISQAEIASQNTREEIRNGARLLRQAGVERILLVTSPTHISRCIRDACSVFEAEEFAAYRRELYATPSDTCYLGYRAEDVVVFEPPHRADRHSHPTHLNVQRVLQIPEKQLVRFLRKLNDLLQDEFSV